MVAVVYTQNTVVQNTPYGTPDNVYGGIESIKLGQEAADFNYDADTTLAIGTGTDDNWASLIKATLLSNIPVGATNISATLYLSGGGGFGTFTGETRRCLRNWVSTEAHWEEYSSGNDWTSNGCTGDGTDREATVDGTITADGGYQSVDVTAITAAIVGGASNYGAVLNPAGAPDSGFRFFERETASDLVRPEWHVQYDAPPSGITADIATEGVGHTSDVECHVLGEVVYDGTIPDDSEWNSVSFYWLTVNDLGYTPTAGENLHYTLWPTLVVGTDTVPELDLPGNFAIGIYFWSNGSRIPVTGLGLYVIVDMTAGELDITLDDIVTVISAQVGELPETITGVVNSTLEDIAADLLAELTSQATVVTDGTGIIMASQAVVLQPGPGDDGKGINSVKPSLHSRVSSLIRRNRR